MAPLDPLNSPFASRPILAASMKTKKHPWKNHPLDKDDPPSSDEARRIIQQYIDDLRALLEKLRCYHN
jgi:hypothetical protein